MALLAIQMLLLGAMVAVSGSVTEPLINDTPAADRASELKC